MRARWLNELTHKILAKTHAELLKDIPNEAFIEYAHYVLLRCRGEEDYDLAELKRLVDEPILQRRNLYVIQDLMTAYLARCGEKGASLEELRREFRMDYTLAEIAANTVLLSHKIHIRAEDNQYILKK